MRTNVRVPQQPLRTHQGAPAVRVSNAVALRRAVMSNYLFEKNFYESGMTIADRIRDLTMKVTFEEAAEIVVDAREKMKLRHVPLLILRELLRGKHGRKLGDLIARAIQRPDELGELMALYRADGGVSEPYQLKRGGARALKGFDRYQIAKYAGHSGQFTLRDMLHICHPRPNTAQQKQLFDELSAGTLSAPATTWEVQLSAGMDKKAVFTNLLTENKLGADALLKNLRGMKEAGVSDTLVRQALLRMNTFRVLPHRFIAAERHAPHLSDAIEQALFKCLAGKPKLSGNTALLLDHSGSMNVKLSDKSELTRFDAAASVGIILREVAEHCRVFSFARGAVEVPNRRGFALRDAALNVMPWGGTQIGKSVADVYRMYPECDRLIIVTDEQSEDRPPSSPQGKGYIVNVAINQNGVGYGSWTTIHGWSEAVIDYIREFETVDVDSNL